MNSWEVMVAPPQYRRPVQPRTVTSGSNLGVIIVFVAVVALALFGAAKVGIIHIDTSSTTTSASTSSGGNSGAVSSDSAAILAKARTYDSLDYVYGGGHPPDEWSSGEGLDCSGMIDVAVLKVTGINENNTARDFRNSSHWSRIPMSQARAGDIVYLLMENHPGHSDDHVAVVVSNQGSTLTVFEAYSSQEAQPDQIRQHSGYPYSYYDGALRFHR